MPTVKSQPKLVDNQTCHVCNKCGGTGFYCMGVLNGQPYSHTGFTCYGCKGLGWVVKKKIVKKAICPRCGIKFPVDSLDKHEFYSSRQNDGKFVSLYICEA